MPPAHDSDDALMPGSTQRVYIALGSNLGDRHQHLRRALAGLQALPGVSELQCSSVYETEPMGPSDQPDYLNAVCRFDYEGAPHRLLDALQALESKAGRVRARRWGERTLDLDILLFGEQRIEEADLIVPHVGLPERSFVLCPLAELDPALEVPGMGRVDALVSRCQEHGIRRLPGGALEPEAQ